MRRIIIGVTGESGKAEVRLKRFFTIRLNSLSIQYLLSGVKSKDFGNSPGNP
jgi:hypothetical protein